MVNKCSAPNCTTGYSSKQKKQNNVVIRTYRFPKEPELRNKWINAVPRKEWLPSIHAVICEKHFVPSDFKEKRGDTNSSRKHKKGESLRRRELKSGAIPSQWPNCPKLLSKTIPQIRSLNATSSSRIQTQINLQRIKAQKKKTKTHLAHWPSWTKNLILIVYLPGLLYRIRGIQNCFSLFPMKENLQSITALK